MDEIISKTFKIVSKIMPPCADFIEEEIIKNKIEPIRWAIVEIEGNELVVSVSGRIIK